MINTRAKLSKAEPSNEPVKILKSNTGNQFISLFLIFFNSGIFLLIFRAKRALINQRYMWFTVS